MNTIKKQFFEDAKQLIQGQDKLDDVIRLWQWIEDNIIEPTNYKYYTLLDKHINLVQQNNHLKRETFNEMLKRINSYN